MVSIYKVYLFKPVIIVNTKGQVFGQAGRSRQPAPIVTASTTYSIDKWNLIDIVILAKHTITEKITINKFYEVFIT